MEFGQQRFSRGIRVFALVLLAQLSACGGSESDDTSTGTPSEQTAAIDAKNETVEALYDKAFETFNRKAYKASIEQFEEVERQHPFSEWAARAQIMAAYAAYRGGQFDDAIVILDRFVKLHPTHPSAAYAYYLTALTYYTQISDVGRDQKATEQARTALKDVIERFPESDYARDAKIKFDLTEDHLAGKEMEVGRYYLKRMDYSAAIKRFKYVIDHYQTTSHTPEALHRLVEAYLRLGVLPEAKKYAAVLGYNQPGSEWYKYSYEMLQGNLSPEEKKTFLQNFMKL